VMPKRLPLVDVTEMNLDSWNFDCRDRISKGNAGMSVGTRINHNAILLIDRGMDCIYQHALMVRLQSSQFNLKAIGLLL